jgi:predicted nucleic acid-binding protein
VTGYCLDSWAILRWLEGGLPASHRVDEVLAERPHMSWINVAEVFYITARAAGSTVAQDVVRDLRASLDLDLPTVDRVLQAAAIKADHPMALADAFAVATAVAHDAVLLTGDPEIIDSQGPWRVEDLRRSD